MKIFISSETPFLHSSQSHSAQRSGKEQLQRAGVDASQPPSPQSRDNSGSAAALRSFPPARGSTQKNLPLPTHRTRLTNSVPVDTPPLEEGITFSTRQLVKMSLYNKAIMISADCTTCFKGVLINMCCRTTSLITSSYVACG